MRSSKSGTVHIIGAGLAGLAAAVRLTQSHRTVAIHEATDLGLGRLLLQERTDGAAKLFLLLGKCEVHLGPPWTALIDVRLGCSAIRRNVY